MLTIGLIINPFAGIGGSVALKGSDGAEVRELALAKGAKQLANQRAVIALESIDSDYRDQIKILTGSGEMGESAASTAGFMPQVILNVNQPSEPEDTHQLTKALVNAGADLILFAGGDGTARDVFSALEKDIPVLGIPAGCKIHSGVYAVTPKAAGVVLGQLAKGDILSLREASVMDIDESAFRQGVVRARNFGSLVVPDSLQFVQATKQGGKEVESMVLDDIAADVIEYMEPDTYYAIGSGSTCANIMEQLGQPNTLLGVDIVYNQQRVAADVTASELLQYVNENPSMEIFITVIGGQGHLIGRGNQQISPEVIRTLGWDRIQVVATKAKLKALVGRPLIVDTGDPDLDQALSGTKRIITGYHDAVIYRVGLDYSENQ